MYRAHIRASPTHPCLQPLDALRWLLPRVAELCCPASRAEYVLKRARQSMSSERVRLGLSQRRPQGESHGQALQRLQQREEARLEQRLAGLRARMLRWEEEEAQGRERQARVVAQAQAREAQAQAQAEAEAKAARAQAQAQAQAQAPTSEEVRQQAQVEELTLLVAENRTGYFGVSLLSQAGTRTKPYQAAVKCGGKMVYLGCFATAEEAALHVARSPEGRAAAGRAAAAAARPPQTREEQEVSRKAVLRNAQKSKSKREVRAKRKLEA